jgi:hypothetical protein
LRHGLGRIKRIVEGDELNAIAVDPAFCVDLVDVNLLTFDDRERNGGNRSRQGNHLPDTDGTFRRAFCGKAQAAQACGRHACRPLTPVQAGAFNSVTREIVWLG